MKKIILSVLVAMVLAACTKEETLNRLNYMILVT